MIYAYLCLFALQHKTAVPGYEIICNYTSGYYLALSGINKRNYAIMRTYTGYSASISVEPSILA